MEVNVPDPAVEAAQQAASSVVTESVAPQQKAHAFNWYSFLLGVMMLALGVCILIWPAESGNILNYIVAGVVAVFGAVRTTMYFVRKEHTLPFSFGGLTLGLTTLVIGGLLLIKPSALSTILAVVLGFLLIFSGFGSFQTSVDLIRLKLRRWYIPMIFAVASIACGVLALLNPFETTQTLMVFLGIALAGEGLLTIVSLFLFRKEL